MHLNAVDRHRFLNGNILTFFYEELARRASCTLYGKCRLFLFSFTLDILQHSYVSFMNDKLYIVIKDENCKKISHY